MKKKIASQVLSYRLINETDKEERIVLLDADPKINDGKNTSVQTTSPSLSCEGIIAKCLINPCYVNKLRVILTPTEGDAIPLYERMPQITRRWSDQFGHVAEKVVSTNELWKKEGDKYFVKGEDEKWHEWNQVGMIDIPVNDVENKGRNVDGMLSWGISVPPNSSIYAVFFCYTDSVDYNWSGLRLV